MCKQRHVLTRDSFAGFALSLLNFELVKLH